MIFDSLILAAVRDELGKTLVGGKIERVSQPDPLEIVLRVYHAGLKHDLLLSCDSSEARVHLTRTRRENPPVPPAFCSLLRKYLEGAFLANVSMPLGFGERVLHLDFRVGEGNTPYTLIAEIMGKHSNLILVDGEGLILGAAKTIGRGINRVRQILAGVLYAPPPKQRGRRDPFSPYESAESELDAQPLAPEEGREWLLAQWSGVSPLLASEIVLRVAGNTLTPKTLHSAMTHLLSVVRVGDWSPRVWTDAEGQTLGAYPVPLRSVPEQLQSPRESVSAALDLASSSIVRRDTFVRAKDSLLTALARTRKLRQREVSEIEAGMRNADRAEEYRQSGDLLLSNQKSIRRGDPSVEVPDYYAPLQPSGEPARRSITLDPALGIHENAERFYKRSRKAESSALTLKERHRRVVEEAAQLLQAETEAAAALTPEAVAAIRTRMAQTLALGQPGGGASSGENLKSPQPEFDGHKIKRYHSVDGWEILVGENATSNDYLTTKIAASSDIWLHVRAATSAHGVIRAQNRPASVSPAALQQAAEAVAARSEVKHSSLIPVDYTLKKYVRKPRKSAAGAVTYQNEKTLFVAGIHGES